MAARPPGRYNWETPARRRRSESFGADVNASPANASVVYVCTQRYYYYYAHETEIGPSRRRRRRRHVAMETAGTPPPRPLPCRSDRNVLCTRATLFIIHPPPCRDRRRRRCSTGGHRHRLRGLFSPVVIVLALYTHTHTLRAAAPGIGGGGNQCRNY